jgi:type IV pilus assembly protein PilC
MGEGQLLDYKFSIKQIRTINHQLSTCLSAGLSVYRTLEIISEDEELKKYSEKFKKSVQLAVNGSSLYNCLNSTLKNEFGIYYLNMIKVAEDTGQYDKVLGELDNLYENYSTIINKIKSQLIFPALSLVIFFMVNLYINFFITIFLCIILISIFYSRFVFTYEKRTLFMNELFLNSPPFSKVYRKLCLNLFLKTYGILYSSGYRVSSSHSLLLSIFPYKFIKDDLKRTFKKIETGTGFSVAFDDMKILSRIEKSALTVGEVTGNSDTILEKLTKLSLNELILNLEITLKFTTQFTSLIASFITGLSIYMLLNGIFLNLF